MSGRDRSFSPLGGSAGRDDLIPDGVDEYLDLCTTCNQRAECLSRSTLIRPVHFCEQFDCCTDKPGDYPILYKPKLTTPGPGTQRTGAQSRYTGICTNCDHRETCRQACTEGGIWLCEEYS